MTINTPEIPEDKPLTNKQKLFVQEYAKSLNGTKAVEKTYNSTGATACVISNENLKKPNIKKALEIEIKKRFPPEYMAGEILDYHNKVKNSEKAVECGDKPINLMFKAYDKIIDRDENNSGDTNIQININDTGAVDKIESELKAVKAEIERTGTEQIVIESDESQERQD